MDKHTIVKKYTNNEITVVWDTAKCHHSAICVKNLATVFNPKIQPWIKLENATSAEIIETVNKCPSGALSIE